MLQKLLNASNFWPFDDGHNTQNKRPEKSSLTGRSPFWTMWTRRTLFVIVASVFHGKIFCPRESRSKITCISHVCSFLRYASWQFRSHSVESLSSVINGLCYSLCMPLNVCPAERLIIDLDRELLCPMFAYTGTFVFHVKYSCVSHCKNLLYLVQ